MGIDLRKPPQLLGSDHENLKQLHSFVFQLVEQLEWALKNMDTSSSTVVVTPTPMSLKSSSQTTASPEATFGSIKSLIIKSADIVNAYYEEINNRLVGEYVALSDFGIFEEQTSQDVYENSTNINRTFNHIQKIKTGVDSSLGALSGEIGQVGYKVGEVETNLAADIEAVKKGLETLESSVVKVTANIKTGLLSNDGIPVYGFEVGQTNVIDGVEVFNKFARFTADRLSFYDQNGVEVAYISDYRLYIYNVEITGIYKIGGLVDTVLASGDVVEKWVGRS